MNFDCNLSISGALLTLFKLCIFLTPIHHLLVIFYSISPNNPHSFNTSVTNQHSFLLQCQYNRSNFFVYLLAYTFFFKYSPFTSFVRIFLKSVRICTSFPLCKFSTVLLQPILFPQCICDLRMVLLQYFFVFILPQRHMIKTK